MVFGPRSPGIAHAPQVLGKKQCEDSEENTGDLVPQGANRTGEWLPESPPKAPAALGKAAGYVACRFARTNLPAWQGWLPILGVRPLLRRHIGCFRAGSTFLRPITQYFCGNAGTDPQLTT